MKLFIDDVRDPLRVYGESMIVTRSYGESVEWMKIHGVPEFISFDHDLGEDGSGYDVARWMVDMDMDSNYSFIPPDFTYKIHSANTVGRGNIRGLLDGYLEFRSGGTMKA